MSMKKARRVTARRSTSIERGYGRFAFSEEKAYEPETADSDERIYHAAHDLALSAENPGDYIETEQADGTPVDRADYGDEQCYSVDDHFTVLPMIFCSFPNKKYIDIQDVFGYYKFIND